MNRLLDSVVSFINQVIFFISKILNISILGIDDVLDWLGDFIDLFLSDIEEFFDSIEIVLNAVFDFVANFLPIVLNVILESYWVDSLDFLVDK